MAALLAPTKLIAPAPRASESGWLNDIMAFSFNFLKFEE